jgi:hypothetical protein
MNNRDFAYANLAAIEALLADTTYEDALTRMSLEGQRDKLRDEIALIEAMDRLAETCQKIAPHTHSPALLRAHISALEAERNALRKRVAELEAERDAAGDWRQLCL